MSGSWLGSFSSDIICSIQNSCYLPMKDYRPYAVDESIVDNRNLQLNWG